FASYYGIPKKQGDKTKNKAKNANVSPLNLGNSFVDDNVRDDDVMFMGERVTDNYFVHENVDPSKVRREEYLDCGKFLLNPYVVYFDCHMMGYLVSEKFWRELVPHLYMAGFHSLNSLRKRLCAGEEPIVHGDSQTFWENIRYQMLLMFYQCRLETMSQDARDAVIIHPMTMSQESMTASARTTQPKI
ncbi:hypothetical protein Tco_0819412, partial [Tanacetum coccineum]